MYSGILLVGIKDAGFDFLGLYSKVFTGKPQGVLTYNITIAVIFTVLMGFMDVLFFSVPLFDLFKFFRKDDVLQERDSTLTKLMKVYIIANLLIIPIDALIYALARNIGDAGYPVTMGLVVFGLSLIEPVWFSAAITRGINVVYKFDPIIKRLVFVIVFIWSLLLANAFGYMFSHWVTALFK